MSRKKGHLSSRVVFLERNQRTLADTTAICLSYINKFVKTQNYQLKQSHNIFMYRALSSTNDDDVLRAIKNNSLIL